MADIADPSDDALVTDAILNAVFKIVPIATPLGTGGEVLKITDDRTLGCFEKLRDAVITALVTDRARRERHRVPPSDERVLTAAETAKRLGLSRFTLLRMRQQPDAGGLPFIQLSQGRIGYRLSDIEAYLTARRVGKLPGEAAEPPKRHQAIRPATTGGARVPNQYTTTRA